jgi:hypothetical protein
MRLLQRQQPFRFAAVAKKAAYIPMAMSQQALDSMRSEKTARACN